MAYPISVVQLNIDCDRPEENRAAALDLTREAIARGAKLVLLPEAAITDLFRGAEAQAQSIPGALTAEFSALAGDSTIALPLLEKSGGGAVYSACALIGKSGVIGVARRTHLYRDPAGLDLFDEREVLAAGEDLAVIETGGVRVGIALGFDAEFPETFRTLALKGADVVLAALNCVHPELGFLCAMAKRNCMPIAVANRLGFKRVYPSSPEFSATAQPFVQDQRGAYLLRAKGGSAIIGADGMIEAQPKAHLAPSGDAALPERLKIPEGHFQEEEILTASFVIEELRIQRLTSAYLTARRPELYS